jgi:hypothetical protein
VPLVTIQRSHLVAAGAVAIAVLVIAFRGPWSTQAAANDVTSVPAALASAPQVIYVDQLGRPIAMALPSAARPLVPAVETLAYSASPQAQPLVQPISTVRTTPAPRVVRSSQPVTRTSERGRSWQKSALIIGGSAGTGAGIGGLVGGKKGAAIGAAIGGGGAALYEAVKR